MALAAFMKAYPFMHMAGEGLTFSYQLAYLLQSSPYFSLGLHLLRQHVVRTSARELVSPHTRMLPASCLSGVENPIFDISKAPCIMSLSSVTIVGMLCYPDYPEQLITLKRCLGIVPVFLRHTGGCKHPVHSSACISMMMNSVRR